MNKLIVLLTLPVLALCSSSGTCGQSKFKDAGKFKDNLTFQGWLARHGEFPHQALLTYLGEGICGGVLIDERHVLTAAHCTRGDPASEHAVVLGEHNRAKKNKHRRTYSVESITEHAEYDDRTMVNDLALLRLAEEVEFSEYIRPVCLPEAGQKFDGATVTVHGWSSFQPGSELTDEARYVNVDVSAWEECRECYNPEPITEGMICVGFCGKAKKHYACQGDLGGAAVAKVCDNPDAGGFCSEGGIFYLAGIVSWGYGCEDVYPGVLTETSHYIDWINEHKG